MAPGIRLLERHNRRAHVFNPELKKGSLELLILSAL